MSSDEDYGSEHVSEKPEEGSEEEAAVEEPVGANAESDSDAAKPATRGRGRGRPRGRPRGSGRGTARPSTRGTRGRKSGISITLKNPNYNAQDDGEDSVAATPSGDLDDADIPEAKMYREVGGIQYEFTGEELVLPQDPAGETKIDSLGRLQGGRVFKGSGFTSAARPDPERIYILSIEAARATGYRDSLYYFRRNPLLIKLTLSQPEKDILIERKILSQNLKSRIVTMVTAKTAFMVGGAKMIKDGKWVDDDYYEDKAREECLAKGLKPGDPIGEVGDITFGDRSNDPDRNKNNQAAPTNERASTIYKPGGPTTFFGGAGTGPFAGEMPSSRRAALSRDGVTEINWMAIAAASAIEANQQYTKLRKERVENSRGGTAGSASGTLVGGGTPAIQALEPFLKGSAVSEVIPPTNVAKEQFISQSVDTVPILTSGLSQAALRALNIKRPGFDENGSPVKRKRVKLEMDNTTKGVYEPHTGLTIYRSDTQPTRSHMERIYGNQPPERGILGGSNVGSNAWAVLYEDVYLEHRDVEAEKESDLRAQLAKISLGGSTT